MTEDKTREKQNKEKNTDTANIAEVMRLKTAWEQLRRHQAFMPFKARIYSVDVVDDGKGGKRLCVQMSDGGKIHNAEEKKNLVHSIRRRRKHSFSRLMSLISIARVAGVDTVSSDLPPRIRRAFIRAYKRHYGNRTFRNRISLNQKLQNIAETKRQHFIENALIRKLAKEKAAR